MASPSRNSSVDKQKQIDHVEATPIYSILERFPLLNGKSDEELRALDKAVLRKLDWKFLPCISAMLLMNYLDRINVSNARLAGMQEDCNMTDVQWSAGISLFYVGYIIGQVPGNVIIAKGRPRILLPICMLLWSVVTLCMMAMRSPWSFILCRFLVGLAEGPFLPAVSLMTSSWYTKHESPLRMAIWHAGNIISNVISGLLAAAILTNMDGVANLHAWQWFICLEGIVSIMVAFIGFKAIPNWPGNTGTFYFTAEENEMSAYRAAISAGGQMEDEEGGYWQGVAMACRDPFTWMFAMLHFSLIITQSYKDFLPSIVDTFGFSEVATYLVQAPPWLVAYFATLAISWSSGRMLEHCWHIVASTIMCLVGAVVMISTLNVAARYFAVFLLCSGSFVGLNIQISWETTVVPRPRTKRAALIAIANCVSSVSHWFTPYFFLTSQEPRYETGGGVIIAGCGVVVLSCLVTRWWCIRKNKGLEVEEGRTGVVTEWRFAT